MKSYINTHLTNHAEKILIIVVPIILLACNSTRNARKIEQLLNQRIKFPWGYVERPCNSHFRLDSLLNKKIKIITYVDDITCTSCSAKYLSIWQDLIKGIDPNVAYIIVVHPIEGKTFSDFSDSLQLCYPLMEYQPNEFCLTNKLENLLARNKTFLLGKDNEVILVGEPFGRDKLSNLYKKCIDSLRVCYGENSCR